MTTMNSKLMMMDPDHNATIVEVAHVPRLRSLGWVSAREWWQGVKRNERALPAALDEYAIVGWVRVGLEDDGGEVGYVLGHHIEDPTRWVTAWYRKGDRSWCHDNYFEGDRSNHEAFRDFLKRINGRGAR